MLGGNRREAEWLVGEVLGCSRAQLITCPECCLTTDQQTRLDALLVRCAQGEPLAYVLGHWAFWSLELVVNPNVLIPRPETELLVEAALARIPVGASCAVADLGTGSGAIALSVASERPSSRVTATDVSMDALAVAETNARRLGQTNVTFLAGDWCVPLMGQHFSVILSNPPYIAENDPHLKALRFEPQGALTSGTDGLEAIRTLVAESRACLASGGTLLLEHGHDQGLSVRQRFAAAGYQDIETLHDLEGRERVTLGRWM